MILIWMVLTIVGRYIPTIISLASLVYTSNFTMVYATGAVIGPAGFSVFRCRIARQLEVVPVGWKLCPSVRSCACQLEVAHVS